jgi:hypothetical protein
MVGEKATEKLTKKRPASEAPDYCRAGLLLVSSGIMLANILQQERSAAAIQHGKPPGFTVLRRSAAAETCRYDA